MSPRIAAMLAEASTLWRAAATTLPSSVSMRTLFGGHEGASSRISFTRRVDRGNFVTTFVTPSPSLHARRTVGIVARAASLARWGILKFPTRFQHFASGRRWVSRQAVWSGAGGHALIVFREDLNLPLFEGRWSL
jgi:hypothetical protein